MKIHAEIKPLSGTHSGTIIELTADKWESFITVWLPYGVPSAEELQEWGITPQQWLDNVRVNDEWYTTPIRELFPSDSHYQSAVEATVAQAVADALNGLEVGNE